MNELAAALRAWRDRLTPAEVGLPAGPDRRAPGLRREELAALAGVSVDYLVRLEQGRATHPSDQILAALARALRLDRGERDALYRCAGSAPPAPTFVPRHLSPGLQRMLDRLTDTPVGVFTAAWELVAANRLWEALLGPPAARAGRDRNLIWGWFTHRGSRVAWTDATYAAFARSMVADLHATAVRYPDDAELAAMIADLRRDSPWFDELWRDWTIAPHVSARKVINSPVGQLTLDCDVLTALDSDLRIVVYTAAPGSDDASKLTLLGVLGTSDAVRVGLPWPGPRPGADDSADTP
jgi:transcriptional regulator with XRE-family HTH domain